MLNIASKACGLIVALAFVSGCATTSADRIASSGGFERSYIKAGRFTLTSYSRIGNPGAAITIYIEGDGVSWLTRTQISSDPTPRKPLVLELAALDPAENVAYIARPGQYPVTGVPDCDASYWSDKRFSEEVISAVNSVVDDLSSKSRSKEINLIGYSGGAAIGILVAARRADVVSIRTIAGNLEPESVNRYHGVSALTGSLDPAGSAAAIASIPQRHFAGACDKVIPLSVTESFAARIGDKTGKSVTVVEGTTHSSGWTKTWTSLLGLPLYKGHPAKQVDIKIPQGYTP